MQPGTAKTLRAIIDAALCGRLDETLAHKLHKLGPEAVALATLSMSRHIAEQGAELTRLESKSGTPSPSTPSGMVPIYAKANKSNRRKKPGARNEHKGVRRKRPTKIDERKTHRLDCCPHCRGKLQHGERMRTRLIEDIPEVIEPVVTEHTIHRGYCPHCKKHVEPFVPDAMPKATLGHQVIALTSWFHYGLGLTIDQVVDILGYQMQTKLTPGGLVDAWRRLAEVLRAWYEQIGEEAKASAHLHADETGWRVNGQTYWLWF
ncbi:MAG: transposase, partial [Planctomycetes bacterium]|nr:transposase [Planctomycetota bacterium]